MRLEDYLIEVQIGTQHNINSLFNYALRSIFKADYLSKIQSTISRTVKIVEAHERNRNIIAWSRGSTIYVNKQAFDQLNLFARTRYLLHEFMHVLQNMKRLFLFRGFKELHDLTLDLDDIVQNSLVKSFEEFLTGRKVGIGRGGKYEILAYLMSGSIHWDAITPEGKAKFIKTLEGYDIFNLENPWWKQRLS
jgi:hypothetical protein